jgi:hypothetical protein
MLNKTSTIETCWSDTREYKIFLLLQGIISQLPVLPARFCHDGPTRLPYHEIPCASKDPVNFPLPRILISDIQNLARFLPDIVEVGIRGCQTATPVPHPPGPLSFRINNQDAETGVLPAQFGPGMVNGADVTLSPHP